MRCKCSNSICVTVTNKTSIEKKSAHKCIQIHCNNLFTKIFWSHYSYDTSSRRKQPDRSKRSHHRRSPTSSRHGHRQRHREDKEERSQSTSRRRHRDRVAKDRSPVKVKTNQYFLYNFSLVYSIFFFWKTKKRERKKNWNLQHLRNTLYIQIEQITAKFFTFWQVEWTFVEILRFYL